VRLTGTRRPSWWRVGRKSPIKSIFSDGINNWDLSILKKTDFGERCQLELRAEFINALNRAQFGAPNATVTSSAFGTVGTLNQLPRIVQLGLRLMF